MSADKIKYWTDLEQYYCREGQGAQFGEVWEERSAQPEDTGALSGTSRREFLKLGGVAAVFSMVACMQRPAEKIIPYLNQPEEIIPGVALHYASTCGECAAACGTLVKVREGRPIKMEGNPGHPLNLGKLCSRGQASLYNLYDPSRLRAPARRKPDGGWETVDFKTADQEIAAKLSSDSEVVLLTGSWHGAARTDLAGAFLKSFKKASHITYEPLEDSLSRECRKQAFGGRGQAFYRFDKAALTVLFGADPFANGNYRLKYYRDFVSRRKPESGGMSRLVSFEPALSESGAVADKRYLVRGAELYKIAGSLAHRLLVEEKKSDYAARAGITAALEAYAPDSVEQQLGLPKGTVEELAGALWQARGSALLISENFSNTGPAAAKLHALVNLLNAALDSPGNTIDQDNLAPESQLTSGRDGLAGLVDRMREGRLAAIFIAGVNPLFSLPESFGFKEAFDKVGLRVSLADRLDETAAECHYVLPALHGAESWNDAEALKGVLSIQQPTITPIWNNRQVEDSLIQLGYRLGNTAFKQGEGPVAWRDYLKAYWKAQVYTAVGAAGDFESFWIKVLQEGFIRLPEKEKANTALAFDPAALTVLRKPEEDRGEFELRLSANSIHLDGRSMNNAWLLELPDPVSRINWDNFVSLAPATAGELGVREGEVLRIETAGGSLEAPAHIQPGVAPGVVGLAVGWGRRSVGEVGNGVGVDGFALAGAGKYGLEYSISGVKLTKTGKRIRLACVQGHDSTEGRPIVYETTLEDFRKNPKAGQYGHAGHEKVDVTLEEYQPKSIWGEGHAYPGHRWGMAIDLNACSACGACTIACMAENNIPVVGKTQVLNGREMFWIRVDRYYTGGPDNPDLIYQPMLCHHCENAPCETVCPVIATLHNDEGLNVQVYNRCVGTRYCSNNCPYKVRRFNWYEFALKAFGKKPLEMQLNPEVTVREKGVMEKCTFCLQRIREAKYRAKEMGLTVADGDIQPACAQTCPGGAIVFGDLNDPESRVSKMLSEGRSFRALAELNIKPSLGYLTLVKNTENSEGEEKSHG